MKAANVYRQLFKAMEKHIEKHGSKSHSRDFVIEEFRKNAKLFDQTAVDLKVARDYTFMLNGVHHHKMEKHIDKHGSKSHSRDFVIEEFRKNAKLSDQTAADLKVARDYTFMLNGVHHHKELMSIDRGNEEDAK